MIQRLPSRCIFVCCFLVSLGLVACGSARPHSDPDGTSGASKDAEKEEQPNGMTEPGRLTPLGSDSSGGEPQSSAPVSECKLEGDLPSFVPVDADAQTLHTIGQERILEKDGASAVIILSRAAKMEPENGTIRGDYAIALLQCKLFDQAIANAEQAAELEPTNIDIAANLAQIYQVAGRIEEAVKSYKKAIQVSPKDPAAHNNLAVLLVLTNISEAEKEARLAVNLAPNNSTYLVNLGYILFRQKRFADAELILVRAIDMDPESADAHNQLGLILAAQKRDQEASMRFRKALELHPDHRAAKENLAAMEEGFDFMGPWDKK